jgi:hypothetical protein
MTFLPVDFDLELEADFVDLPVDFLVVVVFLVVVLFLVVTGRAAQLRLRKPNTIMHAKIRNIDVLF